VNSGLTVALGLVGVQCIAAALVMHARIDDILTTIRSIFS
jgi:hypothetical protein